MHDLPYFAQQLTNGLLAGGLYVLLALGVTIVFGLTGIVNFAHGEFLVLGAFLFIAVNGGGVWGFVLAALAAAAAVGVLGVASERLLFRFTLDRPLSGFVVSLGLIAILQSVFVGVWGLDPTTTRAPLSGVASVGGVLVPWQSVLVFCVTIAAVAGLFVLLRRTKPGRALRAVSENREMAAIIGVDVRRTIVIGFLVASVLAGVGGALIATLYPVTPFTGAQFIFKAFAIAIIGGLGSVPGAAVVGLALGVLEAIGTAYVAASWREGYIFVLMAVFILVRPNGLFRGTSGRFA